MAQNPYLMNQIAQGFNFNPGGAFMQGQQDKMAMIAAQYQQQMAQMQMAQAQAQMERQQAIGSLGETMAGRMGFEPAIGRALGPQGLFELRDAIIPKVTPQYQQIHDPAEVKKRGFPAGTILQLSPEGKMEVLQEPQATGPNPEDARKLENEFRDEFNDLTKDYRKQFDAYSRVVASAQDPSAAGDLALIFNYMKILDPGSTVREGEFANAQNSGGIGPRVRAMYNNVLNGERLSADIRADFLDRSTRLFESAKGRADNVVRGYTERARRNGINPANVVWDFSAGIDAAPRNATSYIEEEMGANQNGTIRRP